MPRRLRRCLALALAFVLAALLGEGVAVASGTVSVQVTGLGSASGPGINCTQSGGPDCSEFYADTSYQECDPDRRPPCFDVVEQPFVELTAGADTNGFVFQEWTGCDSASARSCSLTVDSNRSLTARFRDAQAPSVGGVSPSSGVKNGVVGLAANASDNAGVTGVEFRLRGTLIATDLSAPYGASVNTATFADGAAGIQATAFDAAGNSNQATSMITIDNTVPTVQITAGPDGATFGPGSTQSWSFNAADATSGVTAVECSLTAQGQPSAFDPCSGGSTSHAASDLPDGDYTFAVRARDAGGLTATAERQFSIDATPPETTIAKGPRPIVRSRAKRVRAKFTLEASEPGSTFECKLDRARWKACGAEFAVRVGRGSHVLKARATDALGNRDATPAKRTWTVKRRR